MDDLKGKCNCTMDVLQKEGEFQKVKSIPQVFCPRRTREEYAITTNYTIDNFRCIKCYLCLAFCKFLDLDINRFPRILKNKRNPLNIKLNEEDYEKMDEGLGDNEEKCLSKWIYGIFKSMGFEIYKEVGIPNKTLPANILKVYGISERKNKRADIELHAGSKIFLFENKIYSSDKKWLIDALNQLNLYNHSKLYNIENTKLVLCFNTKLKKDIIMDIKSILKNPGLMQFKNTISELIVVNTYDLYRCFIKNIDEKNKDDFTEMMMSNLVKF